MPLQPGLTTLPPNLFERIVVDWFGSSHGIVHCKSLNFYYVVVLICFTSNSLHWPVTVQLPAFSRCVDKGLCLDRGLVQSVLVRTLSDVVADSRAPGAMASMRT